MNSLLLYHLSLWMLEALGVDGVVIQAIQQLQRVEDSPVGVILVQWLLAIVDLTHILRQTHVERGKRSKLGVRVSFQ